MISELADSGARTTFKSGAQREITEDKGRCDLLPLDVVGKFMRGWDGEILKAIDEFRYNGSTEHLYNKVICPFIEAVYGDNRYTAFLALAKHYEAGAEKYADRNWEKGLPLHSFVDSGVRHLLKWCRGDIDEPHERAFLWNMFGLIWTYEHHPELDDYTIKNDLDDHNQPLYIDGHPMFM